MSKTNQPTGDEETRPRMTQTQVAKRLGLSRNRVYILEKRALKKIKAAIDVMTADEAADLGFIDKKQRRRTF